MSYFTYIILYSNNKYYVGYTNNPESRYKGHLNKSGAKFTAQNIPIEILWQQKFDAEIDSIEREKQIKGWSREKKRN
jgi:predicted GIY-YIG superfamily endonuclease